ncbi:MAG: ATP-binding protein [Sulfurimicrobium sp.]|nr:ATP-binding protein [Sulfurimicrobium sp.]
MSLDRMTKLSWIYDLYRLGQSPRLLENPCEIYQQLLGHIVSGFEAQNGSLALSNENDDNLTIVAGIDLPPEVIGSTIKIGSGILGRVTQDGQALLLNGNLSGDQRFADRYQRREDHVPNSAICWPLKLEDRVIGALSVNRSSDRPPFTEADREQGSVLLNLASVALENIQLQIEQERRIADLKQINKKLEEAQNQLLQSEKMASIGQLAAGVAHEINNPIGYVFSNLGSMEKYMADIFAVLEAYQKTEPMMSQDADEVASLRAIKERVDLPFLRDDVPALMSESREGITRVKKIVQDLKDFSHVDASDEWQLVDLHKGLDSTLNIVWNELKYKAEVVKEYGTLPEIECLPSQVNQVFMNLMVNAAHAIESHGTISLRTGLADQQVWVEVSDTGKGIAPEHINRIFDPFFTTKPVGKGTGLGLSLSYGIVNKHHGRIEVESIPGKGTTFRVWLPLHQTKSV